MELVYSPKAGISEKKYRHYSLNSFGAKELVANKKKEFFYIGKDSFIIDNLVHSFESGYAAENVEKAISILIKVIEKRNIYPDVILVDACIGVLSLNVFAKFLSCSKTLAGIPFLIEASNATTKELSDVRKLTFVDEIICMHQQSDKLLNKIHFIKKIKDSNNTKTLQDNIKQPEDAKYVNNDFFKRCFDVTVAAVILVMLAPVFL